MMNRNWKKKPKPTIISLSEFNESGIQFDEKY